jgi:hypothetical protein
MHWPIDAERLRPAIPAALAIDTFEGQAWIGVIPFRMTGVRHRCLPALPGIFSFAFPELNVRTYVVAQNKPGVWFFSLDAANRLAVWAARRTYLLPYHHAVMRCNDTGHRIVFASRRRDPCAPPAAFEGWYRPVGKTYYAPPGSLGHWLTARYCLYTAGPDQQLWRGEIDHGAWPLQQAEATISQCTMTEGLGIPLPACEPLLHFARRLHTVAWPLEKVTDRF